MNRKKTPAIQPNHGPRLPVKYSAINCTAPMKMYTVARATCTPSPEFSFRMARNASMMRTRVNGLTMIR